MFCIISADIFGFPIHGLSTNEVSLVTDQPAIDEKDLVTDQPEPQNTTKNGAIVLHYFCLTESYQAEKSLTGGSMHGTDTS